MTQPTINIPAELAFQLQRSQIVPIADPPHSSVGFAQIQGRRVTVKKFRIPEVPIQLRYAAMNWRRAENHPNVHRLFGLWEGHPIPTLVTPYVERTLVEHLDIMPTLSNAAKFAILSTAAGVFEHLHNQNPPILHTNIKGSNILVDSRGGILVTDIGIHDAIIPSGRVDSSVRWRAPEKIGGAPHTMECDVWSMGMTILEVMSRRVPYALINDQAVTMAIVAGQLPLDQLPLLHPDPRWNNNIRELLSLCWNHSPQQRPDMRAITRFLGLLSSVSM